MTSALANQISNKNFLSAVGFKFTLSRYPKVSFFCNKAKIPEISLVTETQPNYLKDLDIPGDKITYGDFSLRFIVDENLENYMSIHNWITGLGFPESTQQYKNLLTDENDTTKTQDSKRAFSDGSLYILNSNFNVNAVVKFKDLFPIEMSPLEFDSTLPDVQYFTTDVTFKYTIYNILDKNNNPL